MGNSCGSPQPHPVTNAGFKPEPEPESEPPLEPLGSVTAAQAAVIGSLVADAAAVGSHWIYDQQVLDKKVADAGGQESAPFIDPPINPVYHVASGSNSCYGDQARALLRVLADAGPCDIGLPVLQAYMRQLDELCGEHTAYGPLGRTLRKPSRGQDKYGMTKAEYPVLGPWRHGSLTHFFMNIKKGRDSPTDSGSADIQIDGACKVPPIVASCVSRYGHSLCLAPALSAVESAIRVTQNTDQAVAMGLAFARILVSVIGGTAPSDAIVECIAALRDETRLQPNRLDHELARHMECVVASEPEQLGGDYACADIKAKCLRIRIN